MSDDPIPDRAPVIEEGGRDRAYASVGYALTQWERMELQFATLYTIFTGKPGDIDAMAAFGMEHRKFQDRMSAVLAARDAFFRSRPDQALEGTVTALVARAVELSIERHRIAHGMVSLAPVPSPDDADENGWVTLTGRIEHRITPPWYATGSLRTHWPGMSAAEVEGFAEAFDELGLDAMELVCTLLELPPEYFPQRFRKAPKREGEPQDQA